MVFRMRLDADECERLGLDPSTVCIMRCMTGTEAFNLLGLEPDRFNMMCEESIAWSLVGNAMSTYSLAPLYLALLACLGKESTKCV